MKWYNLKSNKCPKCSSLLTGKEDSTMLNCTKSDCDFKIGTEKFAELSNAYVQKYNRQDRFEDMGGWSRFGD